MSLLTPELLIVRGATHIVMSEEVGGKEVVCFESGAESILAKVRVVVSHDEGDEAGPGRRASITMWRLVSDFGDR